MIQARFCGAPAVPSKKWLLPSRSDASSNWPQFRSRKTIGTASGRTAIALACKVLSIGKDDEVLIPAYNCGSEIEAVLHSGAKIVPYNISTQGGIDFEDLISRRTEHTRAVYIIHYFGWPQPLGAIRKWCTENRLFLIEDCALSLFSENLEADLGRIGDASIFSLPKTFGLRQGGYLSLANEHGHSQLLLRNAKASTLLEEIKHSLKIDLMTAADRFDCFSGVQALKKMAKRPIITRQADGISFMPESYYFDSEEFEDRAICQRVDSVVQSTDWAHIVSRRRENYAKLAETIKSESNVRLLFGDLPAGVCPLSLPVVSSNQSSLVEYLQSHGIAALPWWSGFHRAALECATFPNALFLKQSIVTLPINQNMDDRRLSFMGQVIRRFAR